VKKITSAGKAVVSRKGRKEMSQSSQRNSSGETAIWKNTDNPFKKFCLLIP
jgi:hypothetical protein